MSFPDTVFSSGLDRALGWMVVHSIWQATLIAVLFGLLGLLLRRRSARVRYWVANAGLLAVLFSAGGTFCWYFYETTPSAIALVSPESGPGKVVTETAAIVLSPNTGPTGVPQQAAVPPSFQDYFNRHLPLIVVVWFLGLAVFLLRLLGHISFVYYLRGRMNFPADHYWSDMLNKLAQKAGFTKTIEVLESALVRSPITLGQLKPLILFPVGMINRLSEREVEAILAHELAHVLRRDYLFNILQSIVEALFYYHPAVWWLSAQARTERECACDEKAIALTGSKIDYAKALVTMQEMAFYPLAPALAFAGQRQSQLLQRVRRIFQQPSTNFNIMEKWIATALVVCSIIALTFGQQRPLSTEKNNGQTAQTAQTGPDFKTGLWQATFDKDTVWITFTSRYRDGNWMSSGAFLKNEIAGWSGASGTVALQIVRPAGTMSLNGQVEENEGYGKYKFVPDEAYRASLTKQGMKDVDDELLLHCFYGAVPADYLTTLKKHGYDNIDKEKFQELAIFRLDDAALKENKALLAELGETKPELQDIIDFKIHEIDRAYVNELKKAGYDKLTADQVRDFRIHGVDAAYIRSMNQKNGKPLPADEMIEAKIFGLEKIDREGLEKAMAEKLDQEELNNFAIHGIDEAFIKSANQLGFGNLSADEILNLKLHGIDADFVKQASELGFGKLNLDQVMTIKLQGIDPDFIKQSNALGLGKLSFDQVMEASMHDIDAEFVKQSQNLGLGQLDFDQVMNLKIHGIDAAFVKQAQGLGLENLRFDDVMNLKIHDIDAEFVKQANELGFGKLSFDELVQVKITGLTKEFIQESNKKGYKFPNLEPYIQLKMLNQRRSE